jgi:methylase of polypeptide subunit release factors
MRRSRRDLHLHASGWDLSASPLHADFDVEPVKKLLVKHAREVCPTRRFGLAELVIDPDVFDPTLTSVSPFLLEALQFHAGERVLDMFCGSGAFAINAALHGAKVVAIDAYPAPAACARANAALNGVADAVDVRLGTFQGGLRPGEHFDVIVANPPLLPATPYDALSAAVMDTGLRATASLIAGLPDHLTDSGRCYLVTSSVAERIGFDVDRHCRAVGLESCVIAKLERGYESYRVHEIMCDSSPGL